MSNERLLALIAEGTWPNPCRKDTLDRYRALYVAVRAFLSAETQARIDAWLAGDA